MWIRSCILMAVLTLWFGATAARGQMAAPSLLPAQPLTQDTTASPGQNSFLMVPTTGLVPVNAAVLPAARVSTLVAGLGSTRHAPTAPGAPAWERNTTLAGLVVQFQPVALAVEMLRFDDPGLAAIQVQNRATNLGLAVALGEAVTLGVRGARSVYEWNQPAALQGTYTYDEWLAGASVRLGGVFYLGLVTGQDTLDAVVIGGNSDKGSRNVTGYGIGLRTEGAFAVHLEAYRVERDSFQLVTFGGTPSNHDVSDVRVAEVDVFGLLLGVRRLATVERNSNGRHAGTTASVGYALRPGLNIAIHRQSGTNENSQGTAVGTSDSRALTLGYQF